MAKKISFLFGVALIAFAAHSVIGANQLCCPVNANACGFSSKICTQAGSCTFCKQTEGPDQRECLPQYDSNCENSGGGNEPCGVVTHGTCSAGTCSLGTWTTSNGCSAYSCAAAGGTQACPTPPPGG